MLEDHRIERLLDTLDDPTLLHYRRRAADLKSAELELPEGRPSQQLVACLLYFTARFAVDPDAAWNDTVELAMTGSLRFVHIATAISTMRMVELNPEDVALLPDVMNVLADLFAAVDSELMHELSQA